MTPLQEGLFDAGKTIYNKIATLKKGLPIAESKAKTQMDKIKVRKFYNIQIAELYTQLKAVEAAMLSN